ncbi:MAG TPA: hypothetical protein VFT50_12190 [Baekduia sp.]|nr:hypothetical protein [Baekduia sp.]
MLVALLLACALPATAGARRDDLPIEGYAPADGAVVQDATRGLAIDFTCPAYHQWTEDVAVTGPVDGYHVVLADAPDVDQHGMLLRDHRVDAREAVALEVPPLPSGDPAPAHCTAAEDDAGLGLLPREPGTYWWQAYRDCQTWVCAGGVEVSDPAQVTVVRTVCTVQRALLQQTRGTLRSARRLLRRHRTRARRARVSRLVDRVAMLRQRLRVVYDCAGS